MKLPLPEATSLTQSALLSLGYNPTNASLITDHLIDSSLRGYTVAGLARILSIADRLSKSGSPPSQTTHLTRSSPSTAQLSGDDTLGYLVAHEATTLAIAKAKQTGIAAVGANGTWYTGMLSYYAEMAAAEDLVAIIHSNCTPWVAPEGGYRPMFGTNPYCVGFPTSGVPVIYDMGTSRVIHADIVLAKRLGTELPEGVAYDVGGKETRDPNEALAGAIRVWGGHRGSGLATVVQLMGVLAGSAAMPPDLEGFGFMIVVVDPNVFRPLEEFKAEVDAFVRAMRESPPLPGGEQLRMPFERSNTTRERNREAGEIDVEEEIVEKLRALIGRSGK
jgi:delta1-piperideine-2-carboxylate reductase